ncbi:DoxX family membrane protein [Bacillus sp. Xin]|uniref:DoxX family membrane protein n=1 Tax=unclassified Bacillus (in: firmicutes) TaxID=185979 RepID=UPI0015717446|nr:MULTISPECIES: DoxX family membrane protein [unclassified Bacillus (in: firmicutes)]MBC6972842.1 DoxX family membrane protein [Bacillus sp. Xin]NSW37209.1 DoxX family membrane protein [Bacillus sp. Xin1]
MFIHFLRSNTKALFILLPLRLYLGYAWLAAGLEKIFGQQFDASGFLKGAIAKAGGDHPAVQGWWADFLQHVALPHADLFSFFVQWGEVLVGLGLLLGGLTKTAAFFGIIMNTAFLLSGTIATNPNMILLSILILVAGHNAGRIGLDGFVFQKLFSKNRNNTPTYPTHKFAS